MEKAVHVTQVTEASSGGVWQHLLYLIPALIERNIQVTLVASPKRSNRMFDDDVDLLENAGTKVELLPMLRRPAPLADSVSAWGLHRLLKKGQTNLVHAHSTKAGLLARLACPSTLPLVYSPHSFFFQNYAGGPARKAGILLEGICRWRTDHFVFVSQAEADLAKTELHIPEPKIHVIENGLPENWFRKLGKRTQIRANWKIDEQTRVIGLLARLAHQKGIDWFLRAVAHARLTEKKCQVLIFGDGPQKDSLQSLCRQLELTGTVRFMGHVPNASALLPGFDLFALPSRHEGLSYALLEALAAGLPVVASDIAANQNIPSAPSQLHLVPVENIEALSLKLQELTNECHEIAQTSLPPRFCLSQQADQLAALYRRISTLK